jgi:cytochrome c oxidase cbb3-type subunit III
MSSRSPAASTAMALALLLGLAACDREDRESRGRPLPENSPRNVGDARAAEYEGNAFQISQGQRYYCGGMGPPLMDGKWRYGGSMEQIVDTIREGRPNGMPSYDGKLTEQQMWQLAAYVRSLSAQPRQDALSGRSDKMSTTESPTLKSREDVRPVAPQDDQAQPR